MSTDRPMSREARRERLAQELRHRLGCPFLFQYEAAAYLLLDELTLAKMRGKNGGPPFRKHGGRVAYHIDDLDRWSEAQKRRTTQDKPSEPASPAEEKS